MESTGKYWIPVCNIQLANVVSDTFGKTSLAIIEKLLQNP